MAAESSIASNVSSDLHKTVGRKKNAEKLQELYRYLIQKIEAYFNRFYSKDPKKLYQELKKHKEAIKAMRSKKEITYVQFFLIFPNDGSEETHSSEFDPPLFRLLIANFSPTTKPKEFWFKEPPVNDHSDEANIVRLINARNSIQHGTGYVEDNKYNVIAKHIVNAMVELGEDKKTFENILPPVQYGLSKPVSNFFSRQNDLHKIDKLIQNGKNDVLCVVIHGMAGMGKSELVRKYCNQFSETFDNNILWINSTNKAALESSFRNIAELMGLQVKAENGDLKGFEFIVNAVHQHFRTDQILYVFDDVTDVQSLKDFLPKHKPSATIITSQVRNWPQTNFELHEVKQFDESEGKTFLMNNLKDKQLSEIQLNQIIKQLGGHPLALQQFVVAIKNTLINVEDYLQLFKKELAKILNNTSISTMHGEKSIMTAIKITTDKISESEDSKIASEILNTISYFYGEEMSFDLIKLTFPEYDVIDLENSICQLESMSLMTKTNVNNKNVITVHSLIQKCLLFQHENRPEYLLKCLTMFNEQLNVKEDVCKHEKFGENWYKHLIHLISFENAIVDQFVPTQLNRIFEILQSKGRIADLINLYKGLSDRAVLIYGLKHMQTAHVQDCLAACYQVNEQIDEAIELFQKVAFVRIEALGEYHSTTMLTMGRLATMYRSNGQVDKAIELNKQTFARQYQILGENHDDTLDTMVNLAMDYHDKKQNDKAIELLEKSIGIEQDKKSGQRFSFTLTSMHNLALCYKDAGRVDAAIELSEKILVEKINRSGKTHPDTLITMYNLALFFDSKGDYESACKLFEDVYVGRIEKFGYSNIKTLKAMFYLADCLRKMEHLDRAMDLYEKVIVEMTELGKIHHTFTVNTKNNLAVCFYAKGDLKKATALLEDLISTLSSEEGKKSEVYWFITAIKQNLKDMKKMQSCLQQPETNRQPLFFSSFLFYFALSHLL